MLSRKFLSSAIKRKTENHLVYSDIEKIVFKKINFGTL